MVKTGLKVKDVSKEHFSSGVNQNEPKFTRLVIRVLEGKHLLASDIETGKSDPICFIWCGVKEDIPTLEVLNHACENRETQSKILTTSVCPTTIDPIWNEDIIFPIDITNIFDLSEMKCILFVRDEDIDENGNVSYDELGMLEFSLIDIVTNAKALQNSIVLSANWYDLIKSPGMRKVEGSLKLTISIIFYNADSEIISHQLRESLSSVPKSDSLSIPQQFQYAMISKQSSNNPQFNKDLKSSKIFRSLQIRPKSANNNKNDSELLTPRSSRKKLKSSDSTFRIGTPLSRPSTAPLLKLPSQIDENLETDNESINELIVIHPPKENLKESENFPLEENNNHVGENQGFSMIECLQAITEEPGIPFDEVSLPEENTDNIILQEERNLNNTDENDSSREVFDGPPKGDEGILEDVVKTGIEHAINFVNDFDLGDVVKDSVVAAGKLASAGGKTVAKTVTSKVIENIKEISPKITKEIASNSLNGVRHAARSSVNLISNEIQNINLKDALGDVHRGIDKNPILKVAVNAAPLALAIPELYNQTAKSSSDKKNKAINREKDNDILLNGPDLGDQAELPEDDEDNTKIKTDKNSLIKISEPANEMNALVKENQSDQDELAAQGNPASVVRILRELHDQKKYLQQSLIAIVKATEKGFNTMNNRLNTLEESNKQTQMNISLDTRPLNGDQNLPPPEEVKANEKSKKAKFDGKTKSDKFKEFRKAKKKEIYTPIGSESNIPRKFNEPSAQLVFRGENGNISSTRLNHSPKTNYVENNEFNFPLPLPDQNLPPTSPIQPYRDSNLSKSQEILYSSQRISQSNFNNPATYPPSSSSPSKSLLNRDICDVLDRGSLEDISTSLESSSAKPDLLAVSTRNRLYEVIGILLLQGKSVERCLVWVVALLRGHESLFLELSGHTQKDLLDALQKISSEASKRGMLATLLCSQINRKMIRK